MELFTLVASSPLLMGLIALLVVGILKPTWVSKAGRNLRIGFAGLLDTTPRTGAEHARVISRSLQKYVELAQRGETALSSASGQIHAAIAELEAELSNARADLARLDRGGINTRPDQAARAVLAEDIAEQELVLADLKAQAEDCLIAFWALKLKRSKGRRVEVKARVAISMLREIGDVEDLPLAMSQEAERLAGYLSAAAARSAPYVIQQSPSLSQTAAQLKRLVDKAEVPQAV